MTDVKPLVFRVFEEAEGISLIQGNLRADDVPRCVMAQVLPQVGSWGVGGGWGGGDGVSSLIRG